MKKTILFLLAALVTFGALADGPEIIQPKKLPPMAHKILNAYFAGDDIVEAHKEKNKWTATYDTRLASGAYLTYDKDGNWTSVITAPGAMPKRMIPGRIVPILNADNPDACNNVVGLYHDRKSGDYAVVMADGTTLRFDEHFKPIEP